MIAVYAGSFNPFTNGHFNIYKKATKIFDVVIMFAVNPSKSVDNEHRKNMMKAVEIDCFTTRVIEHDGLVADYCKKNDIRYLIRGIRNNMDYMYEEEIAKINSLIYPELETIYFRANNPLDPAQEVLSSSMIRTFMNYKKDITRYVPEHVHQLLMEVK